MYAEVEVYLSSIANARLKRDSDYRAASDVHAKAHREFEQTHGSLRHTCYGSYYREATTPMNCNGCKWDRSPAIDAYNKADHDIDEEYTSTVRKSWNALKDSDNPLIKFIGEECYGHRDYAETILKMLPANMEDIDETAQRHDWCSEWYGTMEHHGMDGFREKARKAGVLPEYGPDFKEAKRVIGRFIVLAEVTYDEQTIMITKRRCTEHPDGWGYSSHFGWTQDMRYAREDNLRYADVFFTLGEAQARAKQRVSQRVPEADRAEVLKLLDL